MKPTTTFIIGLAAGILIGHSLKRKPKRTEPVHQETKPQFI